MDAVISHMTLSLDGFVANPDRALHMRYPVAKGAATSGAAA